jgi:hypothetical protein
VFARALDYAGSILSSIPAYLEEPLKEGMVAERPNEKLLPSPLRLDFLSASPAPQLSDFALPSIDEKQVLN